MKLTLIVQVRHDGGLDWGVRGSICDGLLDLKCIFKIYLTRFSEVGWEKKRNQLDTKISTLSNYKSERYYLITHFNHTHTLSLCISKGIFFSILSYHV